MKKKVVKQWITENGSDMLKQYYKSGYKWESIYLIKTIRKT